MLRDRGVFSQYPRLAGHGNDLLMASMEKGRTWKRKCNPGAFKLGRQSAITCSPEAAGLAAKRHTTAAAVMAKAGAALEFASLPRARTRGSWPDLRGSPFYSGFFVPLCLHTLRRPREDRRLGASTDLHLLICIH